MTSEPQTRTQPRKQQEEHCLHRLAS